MPPLRSDIQQKVLSYEAFLNDVLKEDLKRIHSRLEYLQSEIFEYVQLKNYIETTKNYKLNEDVIKTQVDIGCNIFIQGNIKNPNNIMLDIGLGYYAELTLDQALPVIDKRIKRLEKEIDLFRNKSAVTKSHIKMVLLGLMEVQKLSSPTQ